MIAFYSIKFVPQLLSFATQNRKKNYYIIFNFLAKRTLSASATATE
jgi:hypothetical protein